MRRTLYAALFATALASSLAACSADQPAQTAAAPTVAAPAPSVPLATTTSPDAAPESTSSMDAAPNAKSFGGPARAATSEAPPKTAPHATRWVSRVPQPKVGPVHTARRRNLDLSESGCGNPKTTEELVKLVAPTPSGLADNDLPAFCAQAAPGIQVFQVRPGRDTAVVGQRGTRLVIPARAFDVLASSGPVQLEMREFYSTADIVLAGLGTRSDLGVLETGGMLHLHATANGQPIRLRPGGQLLVQLPTRVLLPGMRLYEGVVVGKGLDWHLPAPATRKPVANVAKLGKGDRWPRVVKGNGTLQPEFDRLVPVSYADLTRLAHRRAAGKDERRERRYIGRNKHLRIGHILRLSVVVDSTGIVRKASLLQGDSLVGKPIAAAALLLTRLHPASYLIGKVRRPVAARGELRVLYTRAGQRLLSLEWQWLAKPAFMNQAAQQRRAEFARQFSSKDSTQLTLYDGLYYELVAGGLGWINCDRLLDPGPRIEFAVQASAPATVVSLVFKGQRSILASSRTEGNTAVFEQVPSGQPATIVALRREKGITYLATTAVRLGQATPPDLQFRPVTLDELRAELAKL
ncbi:MAG: hypothetical protein ACRYFZ_21170 [Janthinobacterium lividum]